MNILLKNANILPMNAEVVLEDKDILIESGKIAAIGKNIPQDSAQVLDCSGKYVMPGLWDMHTHTAYSDCFDLFLANGVTSVRNMWGNPRILEWRDEINEGKRTGPTIYSTSTLIDGVEAWVGSEVVKTPDEAEAAVRRAMGDGYTQIKTYPSIPRDAFIRLMEVARENDLQVVGHANSSVTTDELIELGYYSIEHASILPKTEEEVLKVAQSGMWHVPTLVIVWALHIYGIEGKPLSEAPYYEYLNAAERKDWEGIIEMIGKSEKMKSYDIHHIVKMAKIFAENSDNVLLGTDQTNPGVVAGFHLHDELELLIRDLGFTPYGTLRTGTVNAARSLGLTVKTGSVEEGKDADLLVLKANPLENISNTRKIDSVIKAGTIYNRKDLDAMLEKVRLLPLDEIEFSMENVITDPSERK